MIKRISKVFIIIIFSIILFSTYSNAVSNITSKNLISNETEKILNYQSDIYIQEDSSMIVKETIKVYAGGDEIKRGIYRDFPTQYKDKNGNNYKVGFEILSIKKDNISESYKTEKQKNGIRIYIGDSNKYLNPGYYIYTIEYKTTRQLGYFKDHDELYWNVTGNGWSFDIANSTAIVHLPSKTDMTKIKDEAYTGIQGSTEKNYITYKDETDKTVRFETTKNLRSNEGLTIVVGFPKGLVYEATLKEKIVYFLNDNKNIIVALIGLIILSIYSIYTWRKVGKDPKKDVIIPRYYPPEGLTPAEVKYIDTMGENTKILEATIINLAVKGYLKIESEEKKSFVISNTEITVIKTGKVLEQDIKEEEKIIYDTLEETTKLKYSYELQSKLELMTEIQKKILKEKFNKKMYSRNISKIILAILISLISILASVFLSNNISEMFIIPFMSIWLSIWTRGVVAIITQAKKNKIMWLFSIPFIIGEIIGITVLIVALGMINGIIILMFIIVNIIYAILIKAYTKEGMKIKNEIEGFKLFIKTASEEEILKQTPETFDKYFPYAYVLGLENEWSKKFENLLTKENYEPNWYAGNLIIASSFNSTRFTNSFSSNFNKSISSASIAPGSSSGFSGGGGRWPEAVDSQEAEAGGRWRRRLVSKKLGTIFLQ